MDARQQNFSLGEGMMTVGLLIPKEQGYDQIILRGEWGEEIV